MSIILGLNRNASFCFLPRSSKHADKVDLNGPVFCSCSRVCSTMMLEDTCFFHIFKSDGVIHFTQESWLGHCAFYQVVHLVSLQCFHANSSPLSFFASVVTNQCLIVIQILCVGFENSLGNEKRFNELEIKKLPGLKCINERVQSKVWKGYVPLRSITHIFRSPLITESYILSINLSHTSLPHRTQT